MTTYLVTGAAGFIGARFVESCNKRGIRLICVDSLDLFSSRPEHQGLEFGEKIDISQLESELQGRVLKVDAVFHLGAITDTREQDWNKLNSLNLEYSKNLWTYCTRAQIPFIYASSAATYGDGSLGYEDDESIIPELKPLNLYGESKQKFDLWALEQAKASKSPVCWAGFKFFNVYGYGERHKDFMSSVVLHAYDQILNSGQVTLFKSHRAGIADGQQKRDFVYVEDVVNVLHFAFDHSIKRGIFNLGTGQARSFLDLARATFKAMGRAESIRFIDTPPNIRDKYQYFTEAKMDRLRKSGYSAPFTSLEDGVAKYLSRLSNQKT